MIDIEEFTICVTDDNKEYINIKSKSGKLAIFINENKNKEYVASEVAKISSKDLL